MRISQNLRTFASCFKERGVQRAVIRWNNKKRTIKHRQTRSRLLLVTLPISDNDEPFKKDCLSDFSDGQFIFMQVRRKIINECKGKPRLQKALAMALYIHWRLGRSSCLQNYTINKLHTITKISPTTLKKYLPLLKELGWVKFQGKDNQHLIISMR